jgi:plasmid stability protein
MLDYKTCPRSPRYPPLPTPASFAIVIALFFEEESYMAQVLVRNLEDEVKTRLQQRARQHGHSMEEEIRDILRQALADDGLPPPRLGSRIAARFAGKGLDVDLPELRGQVPRPAELKP